MLLAGLSLAKQRVTHAMKGATISIASYAAVLFTALIAVGFLTAAAFLHLMTILGAANASAVMAAAYAVIGIVGFAILRTRQKRGQGFNPAFVAEASSQAPTPIQGNEVPLGIASLGMLAAVSYLYGRSLRRRAGP
jgi:hypothetical protein